MKFADVVLLPGASISTTARLNGGADTLHVLVIVPVVPTGPSVHL